MLYIILIILSLAALFDSMIFLVYLYLAFASYSVLRVAFPLIDLVYGKQIAPDKYALCRTVHENLEKENKCVLSLMITTGICATLLLLNIPFLLVLLYFILCVVNTTLLTHSSMVSKFKRDMTQDEFVEYMKLYRTLKEWEK